MSTLPLSIDQLATEDIFVLLGLQSISSEEKDALLAKMEKTVLARVYGNILTELSPDELETFETLHDQALMDFLANKGFDVNQLLIDESVRYRMELALVFQVATTPNSAVAHA